MEKEQRIKHNSMVIEGLLYAVGDEGLSALALSQALECPMDEVIECLDFMKSSFENDERGIELVQLGPIYKFLTKPAIHDYLKKLFENNKANTLSQSALETLAIIAYKQPITRIEIEDIRGVGCDMMLRKLQSRCLIEEVGRSDSPGRPILYQVTQEFLDSFKLLSLDELPKLPQFDQEDDDQLFR